MNVMLKTELFATEWEQTDKKTRGNERQSMKKMSKTFKGKKKPH